MKKLQSRKDRRRRNYYCAPSTQEPKNDQEAYKSLASLLVLSIFKRKKVIGERQFRQLQYQTWVRNPDTKRLERRMRFTADL